MKSFEQRMRAERHGSLYRIDNPGFVDFDDAIKLAREADAIIADLENKAISAEAAQQGMETELINLRNGYYRDEEIARLTKIEEAFETMTGINLDLIHKNKRLTALNAAKGELIAKLTEYFDSDYNKVPEDIAALRARIRSLESE